MAQGDTVNRILRSAIVLFAERGFAETSLRTITGMADVNLAAVNYHFGNKKALIQAVFSYFLSPFCRRFEAKLNDIESADPANKPTVEQILRAALESIIESTEEVNERPQRFMRLLSLAYTQSQDHLRQYLILHYGPSYKRFINLLQGAAPGLDPITFYWRLHFLLGATVFTLSSLESIEALLDVEHDVGMDIQSAVDYLVPSLTGMLNSQGQK